MQFLIIILFTNITRAMPPHPPRNCELQLSCWPSHEVETEPPWGLQDLQQNKKTNLKGNSYIMRLLEGGACSEWQWVPCALSIAWWRLTGSTVVIVTMESAAALSASSKLLWVSASPVNHNPELHLIKWKDLQPNISFPLLTFTCTQANYQGVANMLSRYPW